MFHTIYTASTKYKVMWKVQCFFLVLKRFRSHKQYLHSYKLLKMHEKTERVDCVNTQTPLTYTDTDNSLEWMPRRRRGSCEEHVIPGPCCSQLFEDPSLLCARTLRVLPRLFSQMLLGLFYLLNGTHGEGIKLPVGGSTECSRTPNMAHESALLTSWSFQTSPSLRLAPVSFLTFPIMWVHA